MISCRRKKKRNGKEQINFIVFRYRIRDQFLLFHLITWTEKQGHNNFNCSNKMDRVCGTCNCTVGGIDNEHAIFCYCYDKFRGKKTMRKNWGEFAISLIAPVLCRYDKQICGNKKVYKRST